MDSDDASKERAGVLERRASKGHGGTQYAEELSPSSAVINGDSQIELWQASARNEVNEDDTGIIARLVRVCVDSLACLARLNESHLTWARNKNILGRCVSLLRLWGDAHDVWDGRLDRTLDRSKNLRNTTLSILNPLCKVLFDSKSWAHLTMYSHLTLSQASTVLCLHRRTPNIRGCVSKPLNSTVRPNG